MGSNSNMNFGKSFGNEAAGDGSAGGSGRPPGSGLGSGNFGLARQLSIYSLTFDEFQNTLGGMGKDFGSMNMDELLKNIWSAEETQCMTTGAGAAAVAAAAAAAAAVGSSGQDGRNSGGYLQRQGSLTLPRTLSQKTVDEVWKDIAKEFNGTKDGGGGSNVAQNQREQTLGEITLEEFLVRAGVVREDTEVLAKPNNANAAAVAAAGMFADFSRSNNNNSNNNTNTGFGINFQQSGRGVELMGNRLADNNHQMSLQSANLPLNVNGVRTSQQQPTPVQMSQQSQQQQQQQHLQQQQPLFPKQPAISYASAMTLPSNAQLGNTGLRGGIVGLADPGMNNNLVTGAAQQGGAGMGMVGLGGGGAIGVPAGSPAALSSDGLGRSNGDSSSVSPVPYMFNGGGLRGRKGIHAVDKVVERRQRRMIKNRESAARSRARKQAYTMELEQEVEKLKEENLELRKKQAEIMEQQKNQVMEMMNNAQTGSRKKLRRTQTGPW
ncbi:bZIP transcription factor 23-like [Chenopodium quinoa]|uniref:bZIP transcription factor 23-like n=1 Tax=Chenopodium quinoa TaxID=63459 RepID=UPI000B788609|nr:bZIP transcription factor 23-like [Chenopodium quinoa]